MFTFFPLLLLYGLVMVLGFVLPSWRVWKLTGLNPYVLPKSDTAYGYVSFLMKLILISLAIYLITINYSASFLQFLLEIGFLKQPAFMYGGYFLAFLSLGIMIIAQFQMGQSWRIGIDEENETQLKTSGLFKLSRNPIFLSMTLLTLGLFLITPNAFTFIIVIICRIAMQFQVRLEEEFLIKKHGEKYRVYKNNVRRWV